MAAESGASNGSPSADALLDHLEAGLGSFAERGLFDEEGRGFSIPDPEVGTFLAADPPVEFMRLLPITASEARLATEHGWEALARRLTAGDVELADLFREPAA
jgi:hypothetical protein